MNILNRNVVASLVNNFLEGRGNRRLIWSLLNVEQACEEYL